MHGGVARDELDHQIAHMDQGLGPRLNQGLGPRLNQGLGPRLNQGLGPRLNQGLGPRLNQGLGPRLKPSFFRSCRHRQAVPRPRLHHQARRRMTHLQMRARQARLDLRANRLGELAPCPEPASRGAGSQG